jgi:hypothetical protein
MVAAFVPSLAFVTAAMLIFGPIIPPTILTRLQNTLSPLGQLGLSLLLFATLIGFTLSRLNTFIYKVFEGYFLTWRIPRIGRYNEEMANKLKREIEEQQKNIDKLRENDAEALQLEKLENDLYRLRVRYQIDFPFVEGPILPTRFGNILRAAEVYSNDRYGIDGVVVWPRLAYVIPDKYYEKIEDSNNGLAFLVNCSLLTLLLALLCLVACLYQCLVLFFVIQGRQALFYFIPIDFRFWDFYQQRAFLYFIVGIVLALGAYGFYRATLPIVAEYGNLVRSAFDLFRHDLLKQLKLEMPKNSIRERDIWRQVSEFMAIGEASGPLNFDYVPFVSGTGDNILAARARANRARKAKRVSPKGVKRSKR